MKESRDYDRSSVSIRCGPWRLEGVSSAICGVLKRGVPAETRTYGGVDDPANQDQDRFQGSHDVPYPTSHQYEDIEQGFFSFLAVHIKSNHGSGYEQKRPDNSNAGLHRY